MLDPVRLRILKIIVVYAQIILIYLRFKLHYVVVFLMLKNVFF